jgi:ABC-2 type transport system permease protein
MNWRAIWTIVRKDLQVVRQSRTVMLPMLILPAILFVLLPAGLVLIASSDNPALASQLDDLQTFFNNMPPALQAELNGLTDQQRLIVMLATYFIAPLYLIIPLMVAGVIAADSFAGEKERKTLEALIYTPITDTELFLAKMLTAWIPAVLVSLGGFVIYSLVVNLLAMLVMGHMFFPNFMWLVLALWVAPAVAGLGLGATVLVSLKVKTVQEAYQLGGLVVIPIVALVIGQVAGVIYFSIGLVFTLGLVLWLIDGVLLWLGSKTFRRGELIARL